MIRQLNTNLGYYIPSFFEMHISTTKSDLSINNLSEKELSIFFHEYIHFIQDVTTYYGLHNMYVYSEYIHSVVNRIYKLPKGTFNVPFGIEDNNDNVKLNQEIVKLTWGDSDIKSVFSIKSIKILEDTMSYPSPIKQIPSVCIETNDNDCITFGAIAIMESMAYLMEQFNIEKYIKSSEFPYSAAQKVATHVCHSFAKNPLNILALCDMSLMLSNPGDIFFDFLNQVNNNKIQINKPEDVYDYFYSSKYLLAGKERTLLNCFSSFSSIVADLLKSYLKDSSYFNHYHSWIDKTINSGMEYRKNNPYFVLDIAKGNYIKQNQTFASFLNNIGSPLIGNDCNFYYRFQTTSGIDFSIEFFKAIHQLEQLFSTGKISCELYNWCSNSKETSVDDRCKKSPWERCRDTKLCPYAVLWKHWDLEGYIPKL